MMENTIKEKILEVSRKTGIPTKKTKDFLYFLRDGNPVENNELLQKSGVSKNALNQAKEMLSDMLMIPSKNTQLKVDAVEEVLSLFDSEYQPEGALWSFLKTKEFNSTLKLLNKYIDKRPEPVRGYDQFLATAETTARRSQILNWFEDVAGKRILLLGDDDFTSVAIANTKKASAITVLDIDDRILENINVISKKEKFKIETARYDVKKSLPEKYQGKYDVVFTDPPYTTEGMKLFISRAIECLDPQNQAARIYFCYGNSDRAKERFVSVHGAITSMGLMVRWVFDKFNRYNKAESIGNTSSLYVCDVTQLTKPLIKQNYAGKIYTAD
ncbi:MAG TPA: bis-aminopropyl spermidine synthase family protein [Patescibacteria group bacterium]|nr:bis-aminopropyl spermidine synthase family protein [Patescibacteria group bacterium]